MALCTALVAFRNRVHVIHHTTVSRAAQANSFRSLFSSETGEQTHLDQYLFDSFQEHSKSFITSLIDSNLVLVNGSPKKCKFILSPGDVVTFHNEKASVLEVKPENITMDILYEDEHIVAVNKPPGMLVHPVVGKPNGTFANALLFHLMMNDTSAFRKPASDFSYEPLNLPVSGANASLPIHKSLLPGIVHRLDRGTSGVLLAGKNWRVVKRLQEMFALRKVRKCYLAICYGYPGDTTVDLSLGPSSAHKFQVCLSNHSAAKSAVTHVTTLATNRDLSVALVVIETGRYIVDAFHGVILNHFEYCLLC